MLHHYHLTIKWTGNKGNGTRQYDSYDRSHIISAQGKPDLFCSADVPFRGDATKYNPEDMFLASLSTCHMLWYFHLCADSGIVVTEYTDKPEGTLDTAPNGQAGRFTSVVLHPQVTITDVSKTEQAIQLHHEANKKCFIANSCNFKVEHQPIIKSL